jgi:hypothetical protein
MIIQTFEENWCDFVELLKEFGPTYSFTATFGSYLPVTVNKTFFKYVTQLVVVTWELCNIFDLLERPWKSCRSLNGGFMEVKYSTQNKSVGSVPNILKFCKQYLVAYLNKSLGAYFSISML